jgi:DNA polymerase-3 subunit gamma/tau
MEHPSPATGPALYRKWRSRGFFEVVGQAHVTQTLRNAVRSGTPGHAYLFAGPRGTGKTSTARILARAVNCLNPHDGEPCNHCAPCQAMLANRCLDLVEIDAASNNSVDDVRDLRDKVHYAPTEVRRKVYIVDEVHMLSTGAFNALLKTLEEPPAHVLFVLATTDVHKVPATIASRCQRLDFRTIAPRDIVARLAYVCEQEGMTADVAALELIAQQATGSLRDALSLLDQVRAYEGTAIGVAEVEEALGLARRDTLARLTDDMIAGDAGAALALIGDLAAAGADLRQYAKQLVHYWRDLLLLRAGGTGALGYTPEEHMAAQAARVSVADVATIVKALMQPDYSGRRSAAAQWQLELAVVEACQHFVSTDNRPEVRPASPSPAASSPASPRRAPAPSAPRPAEPAPAPAPAEPIEASPLAAEDAGAASGPTAQAADEAPPEVDEVPPDEAAEPILKSTAATDAVTPAAVDDGRAPEEIWAQVQQRLLAKQDSPRLKALLRDSCMPMGIEGDTFVVQARAQLDRQQIEAKFRPAIDDALAEVLGRAITLRCVTMIEAPAQGGTPVIPREVFVDRAARELRAVHVERNRP